MPQESLDQLESLSRLLPPSRSRLFIVADSVAFEASGARSRLSDLVAGHDSTVFSEFGSNPAFDHAIAAAEKLALDPSQVVLAIGGGAAIDTAKIACFSAANLKVSRENPAAAIASAPSLLPRQHRLIAIPTTAGTGSEATHFAVAYIGAEKHSLCHESLLPDSVVLDPRLTHSLPQKITASSGLDALSQAIESLWNANSTAASERLAERALRIGMENLEAAVLDPTPESRERMLLAANLAGQAINITRTTAPHALSYYLTVQHDVPHGFAVAITVGAFLQFNAGVNDANRAGPTTLNDVKGRLTRIAAALGGHGELFDSASQAHDNWQDMLRRIGAPTRLKEVGATSEDQIEAMVEAVNLERLANNPRTTTADDLKSILQSLL